VLNKYEKKFKKIPHPPPQKRRKKESTVGEKNRSSLHYLFKGRLIFVRLNIIRGEHEIVNIFNGGVVAVHKMFSQKKSNEATVTWRSMMPTFANICSAHFFSKAVIELL
jgi:hypothetical protein